MTYKISPDIQGNMTESLMHEKEIVNGLDLDRVNLPNVNDNKATYESKAASKNRTARGKILTKLSAVPETDRTLLLQIYKTYGRDINVVEWYKTFKN
jgi:hypothetical protein